MECSWEIIIINSRKRKDLLLGSSISLPLNSLNLVQLCNLYISYSTTKNKAHCYIYGNKKSCTYMYRFCNWTLSWIVQACEYVSNGYNTSIRSVSDLYTSTEGTAQGRVFTNLIQTE